MHLMLKLGLQNFRDILLYHVISFWQGPPTRPTRITDVDRTELAIYVDKKKQKHCYLLAPTIGQET